MRALWGEKMLWLRLHLAVGRREHWCDFYGDNISDSFLGTKQGHWCRLWPWCIVGELSITTFRGEMPKDKMPRRRLEATQRTCCGQSERVTHLSGGN